MAWIQPWYNDDIRLTVVILLVAGCSCGHAEAAAKPEPAPRTKAAQSLEELSAEYRRLRSVRSVQGHFNQEVDGWGGRKHTVMGALLARLGTPGTARAKVVVSMGEPDQIAQPETDLWSYAVEGSRSVPEGSELLVYEWRGLHDFLYFLVSDDKVVRAGWWMAGE
jgi:hypothetical protein